MSTAAVTSNLVSQASPGYFQQRRVDLQQLGQDLQSGNLGAAQQDFSTIQTLAQNGPFAGNAFEVSQRQQDFTALGQALTSGDLNGAQQALSQLYSTFQHRQAVDPAPTKNVASSPSTSGQEIVLNLGNPTPGEQITINLNNTANGNDQLTIGVSSQQGSNPEQITLNLNPNSNQEIVLNLFDNNAASNSTQNSSLNVSA